ncbi:MAG: hypothetical protein RBS53_03830 [Bacteroidales bacterium]|jgi:hypothetical protein|nr:hypothetical protein [Bacteroidales bacterium]NLM92005.1 hypothetical protein [Bacteroidales bacterium]
MNRKDDRPSKISYERHLNQLGIPEQEKKSNGGIIPDYVKYGTWLRVNNSEFFEEGYQAWKAKVRAEEGYK